MKVVDRERVAHCGGIGHVKNSNETIMGIKTENQ